MARKRPALVVTGVRKSPLIEKQLLPITKLSLAAHEIHEHKAKVRNKNATKKRRRK